MHMRGEDGVPVRPLLPPAALAAAAMVGSCAYVIDGGWVAYLEGTASLVDVRRLACVAVLSCLFAAAACRLSSTGPAASFAASASILRFMAAGCALAALASTGWLLRMDASRSARAHLSMPLSIAVSGDAAKSATGWSASGVVNDAPEGAVRLRISSSDELSRGSVVRLYGSLEELPDSAWGRSRFVRGEVGVVSVRRFTVERMDASLLDSLRSTVLAVIEPQRDDARALCAGIVCGNTTYLSGSEASEVFSVCGLSHLVAVSGGHLVLISSFLQRMLTAVRLRRPLRISLLAVVCCSLGGDGAGVIRCFRWRPPPAWHFRIIDRGYLHGRCGPGLRVRYGVSAQRPERAVPWPVFGVRPMASFVRRSSRGLE